MLSLRSDLPFGADDSGRFLPWLIAFMVLFATLAIAGTFALDSVARKWSAGVNDTLTVQLPRSERPGDDQQSLSLALGSLRRMEGVLRADALDPEQVRDLLEPWLGAGARSDALPLPQVIDIQIDRKAGLGADQVAARLKDIVEGAVVDDHGRWLEALVRTVRSAELLGAGILLLICLATVGTVVFATRTALGLHRDVIEVLHHIGAQDSYIARQFAMRSAVIGLKGGLGGMTLALPILLMLRYLAGLAETGLLPEASMGAGAWSSIAALVPGVALIAMLTARLTVTRTLAKMF